MIDGAIVGPEDNQIPLQQGDGEQAEEEKMFKWRGIYLCQTAISVRLDGSYTREVEVRRDKLWENVTDAQRQGFGMTYVYHFNTITR